MKSKRLEDMVRGWLIGNFEPSVYKTEAFEAAVKEYEQEEYEAAHYHKIATEITVVVSGEVKMCGTRWRAGDIIILEPGDITDFTAITKAVLTVIKIPGAPKDKYLVEEKTC